MPTILQRYQKISRYPCGKLIFAKLVGWSAPFFAKIKPKFIDLRTAYCETQIHDRRGVRNHFGTINAGALCSLAEMTGGLALDTVVPTSMRWIPKSMTVQYITKASGTITAVSEFNPEIVKEGDVIIPITVRNNQNITVFTADITFYISQKKKS